MVLRTLCLMSSINFILISISPLVSAEDFKKIDIYVQKMNLSVSTKQNVKENKLIKISVELALTDQEQERGLMYRKTLDSGKGMLFVFPDESYRSFWMKNTLVPLSIAFIDSKKTIFQVSDLNPVKTLAQKNVESAQSIKPAKYVLEVPRGWFKTNNISIGSKLVFKDKDITK